MNQNNFKPLFILLLLLASLSTTFGQEAKDTVYFDEDFSICEKPVAEYYRVCTLNKTDNIFYKGDAEDRFIDGRLKVKGRYTDSGLKDDEFVFYNANGTISKKGDYKEGEMVGNWQFYDTTGNLKAIFNCKSSADITPVLLINVNNDTLLRNGNGKFILNTQKDFPFIFFSETNYIVEGKVADSLKTGFYDFSVYTGNSKLVSTEKYEKGILKGKPNGMLSLSAKILNAEDENLAKIDAFDHSNLVFGSGTTGQQKMINFLVHKISPSIPSQATNLSDNYSVVFGLIGYVLKRSLYQSNPQAYINLLKEDPIDIFYSVVKNDMVYVYNSYKYNMSTKEKPRVIHGNITLTVDTLGHIADQTFDANLTKGEIKKIYYYLEHASKLMPYTNGIQKQNLILKLALTTFQDTVKQHDIECKYAIYNADSLDDNTVLDHTTPLLGGFPGGPSEWISFLTRNLNAMVPASHNAPNGNYTVVVSFYVDADGNVSDVKAETDPGYGTAQEAVRVLKKVSKWKPATKNGKPIAYRQKQNIVFQVSGQ